MPLNRQFVILTDLKRREYPTPGVGMHRHALGLARRQKERRNLITVSVGRNRQGRRSRFRIGEFE